MNRNKTILKFAVMLITICLSANGQPPTPIMGWSSWNNFRVKIDEKLIKAQADAMAHNGMKEAGYQYVNIDDGFFISRNTNGHIEIEKNRFPHGMRIVSDYIHGLGLKAGIYSDAGINTCSNRYDDPRIVGCGLYGHDYDDLKTYLVDWNYDFIKVDWCGGEDMQLDEQTRYTDISRIIRELRPETVYNVCRWGFPGKWVHDIADSWRISGDIDASFESICKIIDLNADLWKYSSAGHYNDMDMLQVGRGMTYNEDKAHFSMWCMMVSPLLAGNDLTTMSKESLGILTNQEMIAIDQDSFFYQARRLRDDGDQELWAKPMHHAMSGDIAVALFNRGDQPATISFTPKEIGIDAARGYTMHDVWSKKNYKETKNEKQAFEVPTHGIIVLQVKGTALARNVFTLK